MQRDVTAEIDLTVAARADLIFQVAVARGTPLAHEELTVTGAHGHPLTAVEIDDRHGMRLHRVTAEAGTVTVRYRASATAAAPIASDARDEIVFLRPSRYCPSDELFSRARGWFAGLSGPDLLGAVRAFVAERTVYSPGHSRPTDTAVTTLDTGRGVCRDYAHLVITLLRAMDVPARYASCYAPGLVPMDFHAVAEALIDGRWQVVDATGLADRRALVRIATGRDAADCAFLSSYGGPVSLTHLRVDAALSSPLPGADDHVAAMQIA